MLISSDEYPVVGPALGQSERCYPVLRELPSWFGDPEAYARNYTGEDWARPW